MTGSVTNSNLAKHLKKLYNFGMSEKLPAKLGRPKLLTQEIVDKAIDYLVYDFQNVGDLVTSAVGLAQYLGVTKSTIYLWAEGDDDLSVEFSDTLRAVVEKQEKMLISGGLGGAYNSTITKLMMANHGYSEKVETANTSTDIADALQSIADKLPD